MARTTTIKIRVEAENADAVKKALESAGVAGQAAMKKLEAAARSARPEAKALAAVSDELKNGFANAGREIPGLTSGLRALGGLGTVVAGGLGLVATAAAAGFAAANEYMAWAADLTDAADAVQTNVESLQAWRFAMEEVGGQAQDLDTGLSGLNSTLGAIKTGLGDAKAEAALLELGLDPKVVQSWTNLDQALPAIVKAFENVKDEAARVKLAEQLKIEALLPLLRLGADGFDGLTKSASDLGLTVDRDVVKALDEANRRIEVQSDRIRTTAIPLSVGWANALAAISTAAANAFQWVTRLLDKMGENKIASAKSNLEVSRGRLQNLVENNDGGASDTYQIETQRKKVAQQEATLAKLAGERKRPKGGRSGGGIERDENGRPIGPGSELYAQPDLYVRRVSAPSAAPQSSRASGPSKAQMERDRAAAEAARKAVQAAAEAVRRQEANARALDRADLDIIRAREALATDSDARRAIQQEALDLERRQALAAVEGNRDLDDIAKSRAALAVEYAHQAGLARLASEFEEEIQEKEKKDRAFQERSRAVHADAELKLAQSAADQATTREQALAAELRILDLINARQVAEIEAMDITKEAKAAARAALDIAKNQRAADTRNRFAGPLTGYANQMNRERDNINDALESIAVGGLQNLEDGLMSVIDGTKDVSDAFSDMARQILAEITRLAIRQWVIQPLLGMMGLGGGGARRGNILTNALGAVFRGGASAGARMQPGDLRIVGERGPEQFIADRAGMIVPNGVGGIKVNIVNPQSMPAISQRPDGSLNIVFARLDEVAGRIDTLDRNVESRALGAFGDARRRGRI